MVSHEFSEQSKSPVFALRTTIDTYLDPKQQNRRYEGGLNVPGEVWAEKLTEIPKEIATNLHSPSPHDILVDTEEPSYYLMAKQESPRDNDDLRLQSLLLMREEGSNGVDGLPVIASINILRVRNLRQDQTPNLQSVELSKTRSNSPVVDSITYAIALDVDTFRQPLYMCRKAVYRDRTDNSDPNEKLNL